MSAITSEADAHAWRPAIVGWSDDILPWYSKIAEELPRGAVVVEVGVCHGRSVIYMAERLVELGRSDVELWAIDWWQGKAFREQLFWSMAAGYVRPAEIDMLRIISCEGVRAARLFDDNRVDLCFIDSDHERAGMLEHLEAWQPKIRSGGILAGHDYSSTDWPGVVEAVDTYFGGKAEHPTRSVWSIRIPEHGAHG